MTAAREVPRFPTHTRNPTREEQRPGVTHFQNFLGAVRTKSRIVEERFELEQFVFCDVQRGRQHRHSVSNSEILNNKLTNAVETQQESEES